MVFIIDSSAAVDLPNFWKARSFLAELVLELPVDSGQLRVGLVTYAGAVQERFGLLRYQTRDDLRSGINALSYSTPGGHATATAAAIAHVRQVTTQTQCITLSISLLQICC